MQTVVYMRISDSLDSDVVSNEALCSWWSVLSLSRDGIRMLEFVCNARLHRSGWVTFTYPNNLFLIEGDIDIPSLSVHYVHTPARILSALFINAIRVGEVMK